MGCAIEKTNWYDVGIADLCWFCLKFVIAALPAALLGFTAYILFLFFVSLVARAIL
jgi:hypothetical protein